MPRNVGLKVYNTFVAGLVTETTPLNVPENSVLDADNCVFDKKGDIRRRLGMDYESSHTFSTNNVPESTWQSQAVGSFEWQEVAGDGNKEFIVVQVDDTLHYYDAATEPVSANKKAFTTDLGSFAAPAATNVGADLVDVSYGKGFLFVVSPKIKPFYVTYDPDTDSITNTEIGLKVRDFDGVEDSLDIDEEPLTLSDDHNYNLKNQGWNPPSTGGSNPISQYFTSQARYPGNNKQWWVSKDATNNFDAAELAKDYFGNTRAPRGHFILDPFNKDRATASGIIGLTTETTTNRPQATAFFAGRAWYGGPPSSKLASSLFFSQIIEDEGNIGNCYQEADPTSEKISDLIDTDGGVITIPQAGSILALRVTGASLLVFASNGVWEITGSAGSGFTPTNYSVSEVGKVGTIGRRTVVDVDGIPIWWSDQGIYTISRNEVTDRIEAQSISEQTIQTYYEDTIPDSAKVYAQGSYDPINKRVMWGWNSAGNEENYRFKFDRVLVFDTNIGGFYPWSLSSIATNSPYVFGIFTIPGVGRATETGTVVNSSGDNVVDSSSNQVTANVEVIRATQNSTLFCIAKPDGSESEFTFGDLNNNGFVDWETADGTGAGYESFFETNYLIEGNVTNQRQTPWIMVFSKKTTPASSCHVQGRWQWANLETSSKFSTEQQVYRNAKAGLPVVKTRLKVRGQGDMLTLRFRSSTGLDFDIYGWGILYADNQRV